MHPGWRVSAVPYRFLAGHIAVGGRGESLACPGSVRAELVEPVRQEDTLIRADTGSRSWHIYVGGKAKIQSGKQSCNR